MYKFKVIADYPNSKHNLYDIIEVEYDLVDSFEHYRKYPHIYREVTDDNEWWGGYVESIENNLVYIRLKKEYNLDKQMIFSFDRLPFDIKEFMMPGVVCRFHITKALIEYMKPDSTWIRSDKHYDIEFE